MAISRRARSAEPARGTLALDEVPIVRVLNAGIALVDQPPRPMPAGFDADALRLAASIGSELKDLALPKDKSGRTVVNAASVLRVLRSDRARPIADLTGDRIPRADIDFASGLVHLECVRWLAADEREEAVEIRRQDACIARHGFGVHGLDQLQRRHQPSRTVWARRT
jgi:hypothetical protein